MTTFEVTELWRHPVKSMGGERIDSVGIGPGGVDGDRRWAVRDTSTGLIASAKRPRRHGGLLSWSARLHGGDVVVTAPDGDEYLAGDPLLDRALSRSLGTPVQLVEIEPGVVESYDSEWPDIPGTSLSNVEATFPTALMTEPVSFVDLAAVHLVVIESLDHLAELSGEEVTVEHFRPNIVLRGSPRGGSGPGDGFVDLSWSDVTATVGEVRLSITHATPRCVMTTLPRPGRAAARGILATLAAHARRELAIGTFACFGTYAEVTTAGVISVGDRLALA